MLSSGIESRIQGLYHDQVVLPFRKNCFHGLSRMSHLQWKSGFSPDTNVLGHDNDFHPIEEHGGLTCSEALELASLRIRWSLKRRFGNEPFGIYPYFHLHPDGDGTEDHPYRAAHGSDIFDALPGLILVASTRDKGVHFLAGDRTFYPPMHLNHDFQLGYVDHSNPKDALLLRVRQELLEHADLMKRTATKGFADTVDWYNRNAVQYAASIANIVSQDQVGSFVRLLPEQGEVLDVGCGGGRDVEVFRRSGLLPTGIDLSDGLLAVARQRNPTSPLFKANLLHTPFHDGSFDGLWVHASMHHLENKRDVPRGILEFRRLLRPGGILHLATQAKTDKYETAIVVDTLTEAARFYRYLTLREVNEYLNRSGFRVLEIRQQRETDGAVNTGRIGVEWIITLAQKK